MVEPQTAIQRPRAGTTTVTPRAAGGTVLIALEGEHDIATLPARELRTRLLWARCTHVVIDVSGADFVDSSVVNWLLRADRAIAAAGHGVLRIVEGEADGRAARLFGLVGLRETLACFPTRQQAFAATCDGVDGVPC